MLPFQLLAVTMSTQLSVVKSEFIFTAAPFPSCHASTIAETSPGHLVAAWFGGTHEGAPDVCIYVARKGPRAGWTQPVAVAEGRGAWPGAPRYPCYNPVLFQTTEGPLMLFYKVGPDPGHWRGFTKTSVDAGRSWSSAHALPAGVLGPIKNKPIELADGAILCPSSDEEHGWTVHFELTRDLGKTWTSTGPLNDPTSIAAIQPAILRLADGRLRAIGRTQQGRLFAIDRIAPGKWGPMSLLDVPNPDSGIDAVTLRDGRQLLVYNPTTSGRTPLAVALSDDGRQWTPSLTLESEPGEYSYPAVIQTADGRVHITYTWQRRRIRHVVLRVR